MPRSLRHRLIVASVLWTAGLLALMHMLSMVVIHIYPSVRGPHATGPVLFGIALMVAGFLLARRGLEPFRQLRGRLAAVRSGDAKRVEGDYPTEIQPLVAELNGLLENREESIRRAIATAGDLAHGLKTPLALLVQEADHLHASGQSERAAAISQQVEKMSRQIDYQLARARAASAGPSGTARTSVAASAEGIIRTLGKLHGARDLTMESTVDPEVAVRVGREDLDEILGNLLENASKWAASRIDVTATLANGAVTLTVDDDGPGLAPELRRTVLERGVRADQSAPGSGLGLAIVRDLVELYGGTITLEASPAGGLRVRLVLPG